MRITWLLLSFTGILAAQDYFPLQVGNQWVYRPSGRLAGEPRIVEAVQEGQFGGKWFDGPTYTLLRGLGSDVWLRRAEDGSLYAYDTTAKTEKLWTSFGSAPFTSGVPPCDHPARVSSTEAKYTGPIGAFSNALQIDYSPGSCRDAGIEQDLYLPWVGLVQRRETTIAGPITYDLVYARLGVTEISGPETGFTMSLDQAAYTSGSMLARLTVRNTQAAPLVLNFASGQRFDLSIRNEQGAIVYTWSANKIFVQMTGTETITGQKTWLLTVPLTGLAPGHYTAEGWLTAAAPRYAATVGFDVVKQP